MTSMPECDPSVAGTVARDELLIATLSCGDSATVISDTVRRATLIADVQPEADPRWFADTATRLGIAPVDLNRLADCAQADDPAQALADWLGAETRPRMRKAITAALLAVINEEAK